MAKFVKDNLGNFLITCLIFSIVLGWFFSGWPQIWHGPSVPPKVQQVQAATEDLYVDSFDAVDDGWTKVGTSPYLDTQNQPTDYIYSAGRNKNSGNYGFTNSSGSGTINSVTLYIYAYGVASADFTTLLSGTDTGLGPPTSWGWVSVDVSTILDTWTKINDATVLFDRPNATNEAGVDAAYLLVDYAAASTFTQNDSRWYWNADSVQPGGAMVAENTTSTNATSSAIYRIRMNITIGGADLATSTQAFKLQYGTSTTGCPAIVSWSDVGGLASGVIWRGYDNTTPDDGATTTSTLLNSSEMRESYEEENPSASNLYAITNGQEGEWDWVVQNNSAPVSTTYCFRMIKSNNDLLDNYNSDGYPAIVTAAPSLTCSVTPSFISFGTLTTGIVSDANDTATTTITSGSAFYLQIHDWGDYLNATSGLYAATGTPLYNIASVTNGRATSTLSNGVDGYGIKAATTTAGSGGDITTAQRYNKFYLEAFHATNAVGGLWQTTSTAITMASSTAGVTSKEIVVTHKAAVSGSATAANYRDTIIYTCGVY